MVVQHETGTKVEGSNSALKTFEHRIQGAGPGMNDITFRANLNDMSEHPST